MFIKAMDEEYFANDPIHRDYLDLTAIGIIADAMNMTSLGNNYIAYHGLNNNIKRIHSRVKENISWELKNPEHFQLKLMWHFIAPGN